MKPVLILERNTNSLSLNENQTTKNKYVMNGIFTEFDVKNRNERVYTSPKFLPALDELNERISMLGVVFGSYDHPSDFDQLLANTSHTINKASFVKESNRVEGEIRLLSTYWGKEARSLVDDGIPLFVSSRAAGVTESDGSVSIKKLFTYDIVADPGFASARMHSLNESLGYKNPQSNFRIYEMSDESKINELFDMNKDEFVTKQQLTDYSKYIVNEITSTKRDVKSAIKTGNMDPKKLEKLLEYYDELNSTNGQIVKYLDYLAEKVQIVVNENKSLKSTSDKLIKHNDYLAENLEKSITYSEYIGEQLDRNITYSEYIAEQLDKNITYSEYVAEQLDKNISYTEYVAESLEKNINYAEYIAEHLDNTIAYSEYLAEHVEGNIAYSEYIAENLDDNIAYSEYIAEGLDKTVSYAGMISERLNGNKIFEGKKSLDIPTLEDYGFDSVSDYGSELGGHIDAHEDDNFKDDTIDQDLDTDLDTDLNLDTEFDKETELQTSDEVCECPECGIDCVCVTDTKLGDNHSLDFDSQEDMDKFLNKEIDGEGDSNVDELEQEEFMGQKDSELSESIDKLIEEAKKRKVSETNDLHFLKFLNKSQSDGYYGLQLEEQEQVKLYINEKSYFTGSDVLRLMQEALSVKNESLEERLIRLMPESIKPIWSQVNENGKKSILSQGRLYPDLSTEGKIEHFWLTRNLKKNESVTKKLVSHDNLIQEDRLSEKDVNSILERFKNL